MKALGIVALVLAITAVFVPLFSLILVWVALLCAAIAATCHDATNFVVGALAVTAANIVFFSPTTLLAFYDSTPLFLGTLALFVAPMVVAFMRYRGSQTIRMR